MRAPQSGPHVLLRSEQTAAEVSVIESAAPPGFSGPPLHHHDFDETFYVIEGELTFQLREELFRVSAGEVAFAPRGVPHTFTNLGTGHARYLIVCTPAGFERYFARMAAERQGVDPPEWALQPIPKVTTVGRPIDPGRGGEESTQERDDGPRR
jgi:quercetin dioxygenase-like cupin family protein